jgi:hypothetical protein
VTQSSLVEIGISEKSVASIFKVEETNKVIYVESNFGPEGGTLLSLLQSSYSSGVPRNFFGWGVQQIQLRTKDRERGSWGRQPLVRVSGGSCNLVQEISFHIGNFS